MLEMVAVLVIMAIMASVTFPLLKKSKAMLDYVRSFAKSVEKNSKSGSSPLDQLLDGKSGPTSPEDLLEESSDSSEKTLTKSAKRRIRKLHKRLKRHNRRSRSRGRGRR